MNINRDIESGLQNERIIFCEYVLKKCLNNPQLICLNTGVGLSLIHLALFDLTGDVQYLDYGSFGMWICNVGALAYDVRDGYNRSHSWRQVYADQCFSLSGALLGTIMGISLTVLGFVKGDQEIMRAGISLGATSSIYACLYARVTGCVENFRSGIREALS